MERSRTRKKAKTQLVSLKMVLQVLRGKLNISVRRRGSVVELHNLSRICGDHGSHEITFRSYPFLLAKRYTSVCKVSVTSRNISSLVEEWYASQPSAWRALPRLS
ncbi:hypothetical protein P5673_008250 [Acropora cervicornis]|uniref:Uncharacterized protein n=1 Tax=Acropora cervicornis TaxID=6130 RepID=A0AAD9QU52_ACRCE|nr:hypothetical protein P5673_008250 [Acropora cervicornis]